VIFLDTLLFTVLLRKKFFVRQYFHKHRHYHQTADTKESYNIVLVYRIFDTLLGKLQ